MAEEGDQHGESLSLPPLERSVLPACRAEAFQPSSPFPSLSSCTQTDSPLPPSPGFLSIVSPPTEFSSLILLQQTCIPLSSVPLLPKWFLPERATSPVTSDGLGGLTCCPAALALKTWGLVLLLEAGRSGGGVATGHPGYPSWRLWAAFPCALLWAIQHRGHTVRSDIRITQACNMTYDLGPAGFLDPDRPGTDSKRRDLPSH